MTDKILYWTTVGFAALAMLLFITNVTLINGNQGMQESINQRQGVINMAQNVAPLNQQLTQALAEASVKGGDESIRALLTSQGINLQPPGKGGPQMAPPPGMVPAGPAKGMAPAKPPVAPKKANKEEE